MLARARERLGAGVELHQLTLPELALDEVFDAAVCTFDGLNYLTSDELRLTLTCCGPQASSRRLARLRPPHRRDAGVHERQPRGRGRSRRKRVRDQQRRRSRRPHVRDHDRADAPSRRRLLQRAPPAVLPLGRRMSGPRSPRPASKSLRSATSTRTSPLERRPCARPGLRDASNRCTSEGSKLAHGLSRRSARTSSSGSRGRTSPASRRATWPS